MNFLENYNALLSLKRQKFDEKERNPSNRLPQYKKHALSFAVWRS